MKLTIRNTFNVLFKDVFVLENRSFDFYELIYMVDGDGKTTINNESYPYSAHMVCFTKPGDVRHHYCTNHTNYYCIRFFTPSLTIDLESGLYKVHSSDILNIFKKVFAEYVAKDIRYYEICNLNIHELLLQLSRLQPTGFEDRAMLELIREIDADPNYDLSIQEMADKVSYSYDHFRHKFKEITGQPPTAYIISKRVYYACRLLVEGSQSCTEIANVCGFSTSAQLSLEIN